MARTVKADLHMHPSFFNPRDSKGVAKIFNRAPPLQDIVKTLLLRDLKIASLSGCSPEPGKEDYRFFDHMRDLPSLSRDFEIDYEHGIFLYLERKKPVEGQPNRIYILNSQEVRTNYKELYADINVIGVKRIISPGQNLDETAKIGREEGGIVTICHPNDVNGSGVKKALEMYYKGNVDAIELNTIAGKSVGELVKILEKKGIKGLPVSDSHDLSQAGISYALFDEDIVPCFSIETLRKQIITENFDSHLGKIGRISRFMHHKLPVILSFPKHIAKGTRDYFRKATTKRKE